MVEISTSLLSCKQDDIVNTLYNLETAKPDYFHIDVMDGEFVEENTHDIMLKNCEYLSHISQTPMEVHLMVKDVKNFIDGYKIYYPSYYIGGITLGKKNFNIINSSLILDLTNRLVSYINFVGPKHDKNVFNWVNN